MWREENLEPREKPLQQSENQQQTQPTYDTGEVSALNTAYPTPPPTKEEKLKQTLARVFSDMTDNCGFIWATINLVKPIN